MSLKQIYRNFILSMIATLFLTVGFAFLQFPNELDNLSSGYGGGSEFVAILLLVLISIVSMLVFYSIFTLRAEITTKSKVGYIISFIIALIMSLFIAGLLWGLLSSGIIGVTLVILAIFITPKLSYIFSRKIFKL